MLSTLTVMAMWMCCLHPYGDDEVAWYENDEDENFTLHVIVDNI